MRPTFVAAVVAGIVAGRVVTTSPRESGAPKNAPSRRQLRGPNGAAPITGGLDFGPGAIANDALWKQYVAKGEHLICLMQATDAGAGYLIEDKRSPPSAASRWTGDLKSELATWGWHYNDWDRGYECDYARQGLAIAFAGMGLNAFPAINDEGDPAGGNNECISITHYDENDVIDPNDEWGQMKDVKDQHYTVDGKQYTVNWVRFEVQNSTDAVTQATGGFNQFSMNRIDGAIIGKNINSPASSVVSGAGWGRKANPGELPELRFLSDIYWGHWVRDNPNVRNLRFYGAHMVINDDTVRLAGRAFKNVNADKLVPWPGTSFPATTEEGKALIASPIGATIAHMLLSHKAELGIKQVVKVTVLTDEKKKRPGFGESPVSDMHVFFEIQDVPANDVTQPGAGEARLIKRYASPVSRNDSDDQVLYMKTKSRVREHVVMFDDLKLKET
ncbi:hypothetical protein NX059_006626 [Plenodomus lindquistii]|nr:hypothetical protein NX059_006626 [Plenodomus lindquistii]